MKITNIDLARLMELTHTRAPLLAPEVFVDKNPKIPMLYFASKVQEEAGEVGAATNKFIKGLSLHKVDKFRAKLPKDQRDLTYDEMNALFRKKKMDNMEEELADVIIMALTKASLHNMDIGAAIIKKFNSVSEEAGLKELIYEQ